MIMMVLHELYELYIFFSIFINLVHKKVLPQNFILVFKVKVRVWNYIAELNIIGAF
ncbi:hypothetical protein C2G38_2128177 [Gigaspora rosea]|uniref:Uncharacterized protein n=1 Tax=Gigaspora rosea TaxID=44941 RepID=A0A397TUW0_9GLOM|nr:hypothetical protein C2G38_2128177 [Gigaspora rosea]